MTRAIAAPFAEPLSELNTTPLIDIMLVLLILFVITIPPATHSLDVPLPKATIDPDKRVDLVRNTLSVDPAGTLRWNGLAGSEAEIFALLDATARLKPEPELRFEPDGRAPYEPSLRALNLVKASGVTAFGFAGIERFAGFDKPTR